MTLTGAVPDELIARRWPAVAAVLAGLATFALLIWLLWPAPDVTRTDTAPAAGKVSAQTAPIAPR